MGKLLRVGGMRRCHSQEYTPRGIFSMDGGHGPHTEQGVVTEQPPHCREGQREAEGKHRSATGSGGGGGESAAVGLDQCLRDGQTDTGPTVVPAAGGIPPVEAFEDVSELVRWDALAVIGDVDERDGRPPVGGR